MASLITIGLASIKMGNVAGDGGMGSSLTVLGYTEQDSCTFTIEEGESTDFIPEEVDDPIYTINRPGARTLEFTIMDADPPTIARVLGGTVSTTGTAPNQVHTWNAPAAAPNIEQSIEVTPKEGLILEITRAKIFGSLESPFSKNGLFTLTVRAQVLKPTKTSESAFRFIKED